MSRNSLFKYFSFAAACFSGGLVLAEEKPSPVYFTDCESVAVTPSAGPHVVCGWDVFLTADFLYWTVRQDGMFYAVSGVGADVAKGKVHNLDWEMTPGFKVGLGYNLCHDGWDLYAEYSYIRTSVSNSTSQDPATSNLIAYWSINGAAQPLGISRANVDWKLRFHDLHLELGRNSYLSQYLKLRVHAGLELSLIDQEYNLSQTRLSNTSIDLLKQVQDFWGIGIRAGLDTSWQFTHSFSFFGDLALAILWGEFDLERKDQNSVGGVVTTNIYTGVQARTFEPVLNLEAGFRWETWFCDCRYHTLIQAGWEHQLWILHNEVIKVPTEADHGGDLVLQGLTLKVRFDF